MKHPQFHQIIETMNQAGYDYAKDYERTLENYKNRQSGHLFTLSEHVQALVYAMLTNMQKWYRIKPKLKKIDALFHNYDIDYLKNDADLLDLYQQITAPEIKCGNIGIKSQILALRDNIVTLERIAKDHGSIDEYYNKTPRDELINSLASGKGKYKLKWLGDALVPEYLKNVGVNVVKPDRHLCRLVTRWGYSSHDVATIQETMNICKEIAQEYGLTEIDVDSIMWQFCADDYFECCTDTPKCSQCLVKDCKYRKNLCSTASNVIGAQHTTKNNPDIIPSDGEPAIGEVHIFIYEQLGYLSFVPQGKYRCELLIKDRAFVASFMEKRMPCGTVTKTINDKNYAELIKIMRRYKHILNNDTTPAHEEFSFGGVASYKYDFEGKSNLYGPWKLFNGRGEDEARDAFEAVIEKIINQ